MVFHRSRPVFHGSRWFFMILMGPVGFLWFFMVKGFFMVSGHFFVGFQGSRLVFHGFRLVFHGSRWVFMVIHSSRSAFMVPGWFFMIPGRFLWFFMVRGQFLWFFKDPSQFFHGSRWVLWLFKVPG